jgi:hypothetical protein
MSYVIAAPEMMTAAATDLAGIGSALSEAHAVAAGPTVGLVPAAADEVSAAVTHLFSQHAASYQALAGQAAAFQEQFVQHLHAGAFSYANAEAAIARFLQNLPANVNGIVSRIPTNIALFLQILTGDVTGIVSRSPTWIAWFLQSLPANVTRFVNHLAGIAERIPANLQVLGSVIVQNPGLFIGILVELPFLILTAPIWIPLAIIIFPFFAVLAVGSGL